MSKLFNLKEWLTVADAARHLSIVFGEEVTEADVLRFALDGHLRLSVNFVNGTHACQGKIASWEETKWTLVPSLGKQLRFNPELSTVNARQTPPNLLALFNETPEDEMDKFLPLMKSLDIDGERFLNIEKEVKTIWGVWGLPMLCGERLDIEHQYQQLTGGPAITNENMDGTFVEGHGGIMCQIMESFDSNPYQTGSNAQLEIIKERIANENIGEKEAEILLTRHKEDRKIYLEKRKRAPRRRDFYPAGGLPSDAVLVVRTDALREFEQAINGPSEKPEKPLATTERNSLQAIIAALCDYSAINHQDRGAAIQIAKLTEEMGSPVSDDTVRRALVKIPGTLISRMK